jgi:NTP pyrophosphatase (non-canonical NTP hydrolase)
MTDLQELQNLVGRIRQERGFTMDPLRIFTLLNEEIGEVARELKRTWSLNYDPFSTASWPWRINSRSTWSKP